MAVQMSLLNVKRHVCDINLSQKPVQYLIELQSGRCGNVMFKLISSSMKLNLL